MRKMPGMLDETLPLTADERALIYSWRGWVWVNAFRWSLAWLLCQAALQWAAQMPASRVTDVSEAFAWSAALLLAFLLLRWLRCRLDAVEQRMRAARLSDPDGWQRLWF